jgi:SH3 domain protein
MMRKLIILLALSISCFSVHAQTVYVSDSFFVPLRSGAGAQFRIVHQGIRTGTQMTLLEEAEEWSLIRTDGGLEGWIQNQYVLKEPPARQQLNATQARLTQATPKIAELENELKQLRGEHKDLSQLSDEQLKERDEYAEELRKIRALSSDAINLNQRYQDLLEKHELVQTDFDAVRAENDRLKSNQTINQWLFGAGLVVLGMILMLILPAFSRSKRHSDWVN